MPEQQKTGLLKDEVLKDKERCFDRLLSPVWQQKMKNTLQNPHYHAEGDVFTHTSLVYDMLWEMKEFQSLDSIRRTLVMEAAILHDVGKIRTTVLEDGQWVSPHHASVGSRMVRDLLWMEKGCCGTPEAVQERETICALVRYHMLPVHLLDMEAPERTVREIASLGQLIPGFSVELLCLLAEADVMGRVAPDQSKGLDLVQLCREQAEDCGCLQGPYVFQDPYAAHAYLSGRNVQPDQPLYDDAWGEVFMMSGLPGTGKDTWIQNHLSNLPVVSLDDIRADNHLSPTGSQGEVVSIAFEKAKEYLRVHQPFVWNATNLSKDIRRKLIHLFERYGARVHIVYLETSMDTLLERNRSRLKMVPEAEIRRLCQKTILPAPEEAHTVEWICV